MVPKAGKLSTICGSLYLVCASPGTVRESSEESPILAVNARGRLLSHRGEYALKAYIVYIYHGIIFSGVHRRAQRLSRKQNIKLTA